MLVWPRKIEKHIFKALEALKLQSLAWAPKSPKVSSIHKKGSALISCNGMHLKSPSPKKYGVVTPFSSLLSLNYIQHSFSKIFRLTKIRSLMNLCMKMSQKILSIGTWLHKTHNRDLIAYLVERLRDVRLNIAFLKDSKLHFLYATIEMIFTQPSILGISRISSDRK